MVLRRSGERRRRVVMDEALQSPGEAAPEKTPAASSENIKGRRLRQYSKNAERRNLPRCADFIPVGRVAVLAVWCLCLGVLLALNLAFGFIGAEPNSRLPRLAEALGFGPCSVSSWLAVLAWAGAGLCSLVILSIRQHRSNDFRGTYRVWRWVAMGAALLSLATLVDLAGIAAELVSWLSGKLLSQNGMPLLALQSLFIVLVTIRLGFELKHSRSAAALAIAGGLCGVLATWVQLDSIGESLASNREFVSGNLWLVTVACSVMSVLLYARFVILHASGEIHVPEAKSRKKSKKRRVKGKLKSKSKRKSGAKRTSSTEDDSWNEAGEDEATETEEETVEEEEEEVSPASSRGSGKSKGQAAPTRDEDEEDEEEQFSSGAGLSRAERKRLKREQRQSRRAA